MVTIDYGTKPPPRPRRFRTWWYAFPLTLAVWASTLLMPWMTSVGSCGLVPFLFVGFLTGETIVGWRQWRGRRAFALRAAAMAVVFMGLVALRPSAARVYAEVFGSYPPAGVHDISYEIDAGHPLDAPDVLLRFYVKPGVMPGLLTGPQFVRLTDLEKRYAAGSVTWVDFCGEALLQPGGRFGNWEPSAKTPALEVYGIIDPADPEWGPEVGIVYDPATGEVVVHKIGY